MHLSPFEIAVVITYVLILFTTTASEWQAPIGRFHVFVFENATGGRIQP
jgi:hypothetical protein